MTPKKPRCLARVEAIIPGRTRPTLLICFEERHGGDTHIDNLVGVGFRFE